MLCECCHQIVHYVGLIIIIIIFFMNFIFGETVGKRVDKIGKSTDKTSFRPNCFSTLVYCTEGLIKREVKKGTPRASSCLGLSSNTSPLVLTTLAIATRCLMLYLFSFIPSQALKAESVTSVHCQLATARISTCQRLLAARYAHSNCFSNDIFECLGIERTPRASYGASLSFMCL